MIEMDEYSSFDSSWKTKVVPNFNVPPELRKPQIDAMINLIKGKHVFLGKCYAA